ncbi:MAG: hypothetical protein ACLPX9_11215 [Rhodomicrobium sp.]
MKHTLTAAALSLAMTAAVSGAATGQVWQGDMFFTKVSGCTGDEVGSFGQGVFSPYATNGVADHFAMYGGRGSAMQLAPAKGTALNGATSFTMTAITHAAVGVQNDPLTSKTVTFSVSPAAPTASSNPTIQITATVKNLAGVSGCDVTAVGTLLLRPGS